MKKLVVLAVIGFILAVVLPPAFAQQYPDVSKLKPFSTESDYMSLPGYLRWLVFQQMNQWLTYAEAGRIVNQQTAGR